MPPGRPRKHAPKEEPEQVEAAPKPVNIAPFDTCRYHRTEEPRIFKQGEVIPEGWEDTPDKFKE